MSSHQLLNLMPSLPIRHMIRPNWTLSVFTLPEWVISCTSQYLNLMCTIFAKPLLDAIALAVKESDQCSGLGLQPKIRPKRLYSQLFSCPRDSGLSPQSVLRHNHVDHQLLHSSTSSQSFPSQRSTCRRRPKLALPLLPSTLCKVSPTFFNIFPPSWCHHVGAYFSPHIVRWTCPCSCSVLVAAKLLNFVALPVSINRWNRISQPVRVLATTLAGVSRPFLVSVLHPCT